MGAKTMKTGPRGPVFEITWVLHGQAGQQGLHHAAHATHAADL